MISGEPKMAIDGPGLIRCFSCRAPVPDVAGPTHRYMTSTPGCWKLYGELLAREFSGYYDPDTHGLTVDAYAVTHPGEPQRVTIQSVNIHLLRLYLRLERGVAGDRAPSVLRKIVENKELVAGLTWLEPPSFEHTVNVTDVLKATGFEEHRELVRAWAGSALGTWKAVHFETIEKLAGKAFAE
jgi:Family of unknown function (DUF5946)